MGGHFAFKNTYTAALVNFLQLLTIITVASGGLTSAPWTALQGFMALSKCRQSATLPSGLCRSGALWAATWIPIFATNFNCS